MTVNSQSPTADADAIMDELFGEVEQSLHIPNSQPKGQSGAKDVFSLDELDLEVDQDILWIAPYGAPAKATPPPPTDPPLAEPVPSTPSGKGWITPVLLLCACGSALLASVLWSFHLAYRLAQLDRPTIVEPLATAPQPTESQYTSEMRSLLSFAPTDRKEAVAPPSLPTATLPPPPLSSSPLPIPQTVYVPVYQPPVSALPPVEATAPLTAPAPVLPEKSHTLVGVLSFGDRSSAMFEIEGTVQSVNLGKPVGNTGWILSKVQQKDVILKRNNETKSVMVGQKF